MEYKAMELDLLEAIDLPEQQPYVYFCLKLSSPIDIDKLYQAVLSCMKVIPELGCSYNIKRNSWFTLESVRKQDVIQEVASIDFHTWNLLQHPQIRIQVVHREAEYQLALGISHILSDGNGAVQLLYMLCDFYNGKHPANIYNQRILIERVMKDTYTKNNKAVRVKAMDKNREEKEAQHKVFIKSADLNDIRKKAKKYHATVNDVLLSAYVQMLHVCEQQSEVSLPCPVNLRSFLIDCPTTTVTNFTGEYKVSLCDLDKKSEADIVSEIHMQMLEERKCNRDLNSMKLLNRCYSVLPLWLCRMLARSAYHIPAVSFTNLGVLDDEKLYFIGCNVQHVYVVTRERAFPAFQITATTYKKECMLTCNCIGDMQEIQEVEKRLTVMRNLLDEFHDDDTEMQIKKPLI